MDWRRRTGGGSAARPARRRRGDAAAERVGGDQVVGKASDCQRLWPPGGNRSGSVVLPRNGESGCAGSQEAGAPRNTLEKRSD